MELLGNFRNFDFSKSPGALFFIMPGEWNVYLLEKVDPAGGWPRAILAEGKCRLSKKPSCFSFYADNIKLQVLRKGRCRQIFFEQAGFKMMALVGDSYVGKEDLLMSDTRVYANCTVTIDHWEVSWN